MKKIQIAGAGIAALGLAVLPTAGTFADVTDTVVVTINSSCSVTSSTGDNPTVVNNFSDSVTNGNYKEWAPVAATGGKLYVSCNSASGWHVSAVGIGTGDVVTDMKGTDGGTKIQTVASGSVPTTGATSAWGMKLAGSGVESSYSSNYVAIPATSTKVAGGSTAVSGNLIYTGYEVYVSPTQEAGTYTGIVQYTVSAGVSS